MTAPSLRRGHRQIGESRSGYFHSTYEANWARCLQSKVDVGEIAGWIRNTSRFPFSKPATWVTPSGHRSAASMVPDFLVFAHHGGVEVHEVKGWHNNRTVALLEQFTADYPYVSLRIIDRVMLREIQSTGEVPGWERVS